MAMALTAVTSGLLVTSILLVDIVLATRPVVSKTILAAISRLSVCRSRAMVFPRPFRLVSKVAPRLFLGVTSCVAPLAFCEVVVVLLTFAAKPLRRLISIDAMS